MLTARRTTPRRVALPAALSALETTVALGLAHAAAGGDAGNPLWLAAFGVLVYAAGTLVLRRRTTMRATLPALLATQVLGHAWLVALTPATHADHGHGEALLLGLTGPMLTAHLTAAAVTALAWALRRRAVVVLLRWTDTERPVVLTLVRRPVVGGHPALVATFLLAVAPRRGPPVLPTATA